MKRFRLNQRQKEIATSVVIIATFGFGMGAGEAAVRIINLVKFGVAATVEDSDEFFVEESTKLLLPRPGRMLGDVRINSLGFRGPEIATARIRGTLRLAYVGGSTTYDAYAPEEKNWPELAAQIIAAQLPHCPIDFLNAGLPGFSTDHMRTHFEHHVRAVQPDVVVILPGDVVNDVQDEAARLKIDASDVFEPTWLAGHSMLWEKIEKNARIIQLQRGAHRSEGKIRFDHEAHAARFGERLRVLVRSVQAADKLAVVVTISGQIRRSQSRSEQVRAANTALYYTPYMSIPAMLDAQDAYNRAIARVAAQTGAVLIGGEDEIPGDIEHFADSRHFKSAGSKLMARRVATRLMLAPQFLAVLKSIGTQCDPSAS